MMQRHRPLNWRSVGRRHCRAGDDNDDYDHDDDDCDDDTDDDWAGLAVGPAR